MEDLHLKGMTNGATELQNIVPGLLLVILWHPMLSGIYFVRVSRGSQALVTSFMLLR